MKNKWLHFIKDNKGQAIVEFCFVLPFFVVIMLFTMIIYEFIHEMITVQEDMRYELRETIDQKSAGDFERIEKRRHAFVRIPGSMKQVIGQPFISRTMTLYSYGGSYQGRGLNQYRRGYLYRRTEK